MLNTQSLEGVCVRHSDDCTPVCVPLGSDDPTVRRVCTKGCNRMLKAFKNKNAKTESEMYEVVTCQANKQVICEPENKQGQVKCRMDSSFKTMVVCPFTPSIWNLGSTCIQNQFEKEQCAGETSHEGCNKNPKCACKPEDLAAAAAAAQSALAACPDAGNEDVYKQIQSKCRSAVHYDKDRCSRLGMSF